MYCTTRAPGQWCKNGVGLRKRAIIVLARAEVVCGTMKNAAAIAADVSFQYRLAGASRASRPRAAAAAPT